MNIAIHVVALSGIGLIVYHWGQLKQDLLILKTEVSSISSGKRKLPKQLGVVRRLCRVYDIDFKSSVPLSDFHNMCTRSLLVLCSTGEIQEINIIGKGDVAEDSTLRMIIRLKKDKSFIDIEERESLTNDLGFKIDIV